ncbi:putative universal stress protein [Oceaniovalibus guishaninsula JLT2003]|uniref:Putative universal stress protein n=1 Tax=Oceaniovalibus guishaninsula JLT2003 TaxID=1231392 RepID=K2HMY4_9RHOB|nr:universal stress protein [Oceaniovalibus guishaninsula]EKE44194.1 putative universal stress protein [Oceaniovalibus guishaninsula JLT2003]
MLSRLVVGLDGGDTGSRAVDFARKLAARMEDCELILVYVIEWSPFSFQTAEENAQRHRRREEEIDAARSRIVTPAVEALQSQGVKVRGLVRHGNVSDALDRIARDEGADLIVVARTSDTGVASRIFGSSTANLVMHATVPVTVVG